MVEAVGAGDPAPTGAQPVGSARFFANDGVAQWDIRSNTDFGAGALEVRLQSGANNEALMRFWQESANSVEILQDLYVSGDMAVQGAVTPNGNNLYSLGTSSRKWTEVFATNGSINTSDERAKREVRDIDHGLDSVAQLRPVTYQWKDEPGGPRHYGLIAQEVLEVLPEAVYVPENPEDLLGLNYSQLVPVLIRSIQEQQAQIEALESRLAALEH